MIPFLGIIKNKFERLLDFLEKEEGEEGSLISVFGANI